MKKVLFLSCFLFFANNFPYQTVEIFEYPIRDIRLRKKLNFEVKSIEIDVIHEQSIESGEREQAISIQMVDAPSIVHTKPFEPIDETKNNRLNDQTTNTVDSVAQVELEGKAAPLPQKKRSYLQKEINQLAIEPFIAKKVETAADATPTAQSEMTVTIHNNINQTMTTYHHWSGKYTPEFSISINEQNIPADDSITIPAEQALKIEYSALFPYGYSSKDSIEYHPTGSVKKLILEFDWHASPRIVITEIAE